MITKIIAQLKTGTITNVVPYGTTPLPAPPYIVVKPEKDPLNTGRIFRIIIHMLPGQNIFLEDYRNNTTPNLLVDFKKTIKDRHNRDHVLIQQPDDSDLIIANDDGTISMEGIFLMPSLNFISKGE